MKKNLLFAAVLMSFGNLLAQSSAYWQQHVDYKMDVVMNVKNYQYTGKQELVYTNNSSDTLKRVFYHLYNNAFQTGSEMDARLQSIKDPDARMVNKIKEGDTEIKVSRLKTLKPNETGYLNISNFKQDGIVANAKTVGTILEVSLATPILPHSKTTFTLDFDGQVPIQIRRSGRNNVEGVELSMAQWYPKIAEFDFEGWHADPYIAREFHGVWGNFDVKITIDKDYVLGGSGYLQNPNEIGHGYQDAGVPVVYPKKTQTLTWHFLAPMVHDFTWAADRNYTHDIVKGPNRVDLHFLYKNDPKIAENWKKIEPLMVRVMDFYNQKIGDYPYKQYSFIQGGDGGMEYAMATLIKGPGLGTVFHEWMHSWYQHILGTNESLFAWMDEGYTSFAEAEVSNYYNLNFASASPFLSLKEKAQIALNNEKSKTLLPAVQAGNYMGYLTLAKSAFEEPLTTHADHFNTNYAYSSAAYTKGATFLGVLGYIIGDSLRDKTLLNYYNTWKFKHPNANDFIRVAEKTSGIQLQWFKEYWMNSTKTVDYGLNDIQVGNNSAIISIQRLGKMPMPIEVLITYKDGTSELHYIPLDLMLAGKSVEGTINTIQHAAWQWVAPSYTFETTKPLAALKSIEIDPSFRMPDINRSNNKLEIPN